MSTRPTNPPSLVSFWNSLLNKEWIHFLGKPLKAFRCIGVIICIHLLLLCNAVSGQDVSYQMKELSDALKITSDTITNLQDDGKYGKGGRLLIIINQSSYHRDSVVQYFDAKKKLRESHTTTMLNDKGVDFYTALFNKHKGLDGPGYNKIDAFETIRVYDFEDIILMEWSVKDADISQIQKIETDTYADYNGSPDDPPTISSQNTVIHDALGDEIYKVHYQNHTNWRKRGLYISEKQEIEKQEVDYLDTNRKKHTIRKNYKTKKWEEYNSNTMKWENISNTTLPDNNQIGLEPPKTATVENNPAMTQPAVNTTNISFHPNEAFIGPAYLNIANAGQGNSGYGSFGFTGEYTRFITPHFGATMDVGVYFKKETQNDYTQSFTQFNVTAGATYIPCKDPWKEDKKFTGDLNVLLGLSSIMVKESSGSYGLDNISKKCFTFAIGAAGDYHISPRIKIRLQADYMHTSFFNTMQNNFRISAGPTIGF